MIVLVYTLCTLNTVYIFPVVDIKLHSSFLVTYMEIIRKLQTLNIKC